MSLVDRASAQNLIAIRALLERSGLPTSDLESAQPEFAVIREHGQVIAAGAGFVINSGWNGAYPSAFINVVWIAIALYGVVGRHLAAPRSTAS